MKAYIESLEALTRSQLILLLARQRQAETEGLAVVGASCRLPGGITDPDGFWAVVREGRAVATESVGVPVDSLGRPRWNLTAADVAPHADLLRSGAYLDSIDLFDAAGSGVPEQEARYLDPQHRLLLTETGRAVADAGLGDLRTRRVGVFIAVSPSEYGVAGVRNGVPDGELSGWMSSGVAPSAAAGRIALALGVNGPALTVDTACSSALAALHLAGVALRRDECDVAIVGAAHLVLSPFTTAVSARAGMLSATGHCRPFTSRADGYVRGEGGVVLVLVRERDAHAENLAPYALVRGSALGQHGGRAMLVGSSATGQQGAIRDCLGGAGVAPAEVGYVEAHGSSDPIADAVELDALATAYGRQRADAPPLLVGSGKANIGYLETAAGATGLLRAILALHHDTVPGQPDFVDPSPRIPWSRLAVSVPTTGTSWPGAGRRLAGVNAYGFTGTSAHVLLEASARTRPDRPAPPSTPGQRHWLDSYTWH
ncbi:beta-ketoacyl [acyl carrier protein] synthase domain-containing protein [Micromonospora sp. NBC_01796]|uniref:beta-ketoacyl [acyl carrier protein] synthase domain-containing protein n=1 Tax=Micromonospora sp. NBC_01796 TaxID=2975987 RepID=UPI002DDA0D88|nr:polyketide synthase [Micromonospora sp. NBC_01796]WSA86652.1 polyketide synthase [Micromonospora sp. NBC_01796]